MAVTVDDRDLGFSRIVASYKALPGLTGLSGYPEAVASPSTPSGTSIATYMAINHDGTEDGRIPARPFMVQAFDRNLEKYDRIIEQGGARLGTGSTGRQIMTAVVIESSNDIKRELTDGDFIGNAPSTIERKGGLDHPLFHFGIARAAVSWTVVG